MGDVDHDEELAEEATKPEIMSFPWRRGKW